MAWIEERPGRDGITYRVVWRQRGLEGKQQQTFADADEAMRLKGHVDLAGNRWPSTTVYVKDRGFTEDLVDQSPTFAEYAERTINARGKADERTKDDYRRLLRLHINPVIGDKHLAEIDRFDVAAVGQRAMDAGRAKKTVANIHALLSSILDDAYSDELVRRNVARGAMPHVPERADDEDRKEMCYLTHAEAALLEQHVPVGVHRDLLRLLLGTGLRWSEATALQVRDVDLLDRRTLDVRRAWKRREGRFELGPPKTRRSRRTLDLSPELVNLLTPYVAQLDPKGFLFTTAQGRPIRHSNYYNRIWKPAIHAASRCAAHQAAEDPCGCPGTLTKKPGLHSCRHTHASWLLNEPSITILDVQHRLGHESIKTTADLYGHLMPHRADAVNAVIDRALARR